MAEQHVGFSASEKATETAVLTAETNGKTERFFASKTNVDMFIPKTFCFFMVETGKTDGKLKGSFICF